MGLLSYLRNLMRIRDGGNREIYQDEQQLDLRERAALEEHLREEARRYEADLRELART